MANKRRSRVAEGDVSPFPAVGGGTNTHELSIPVACDLDIIAARQKGRELAQKMGFAPSDVTMIATAISELARNIILYAQRGEIALREILQSGTPGIVIVARDEGPGIPDVRRALEDGYSTSRSLGLGLPGVRRLMDWFDVVSEVDRGTVVTVKKWRR